MEAETPPQSGPRSEPTASTVIQDMVSRTPPNPFWGPEQTRASLERMRLDHGDDWIVANRAMLEDQLSAIIDF